MKKLKVISIDFWNTLFDSQEGAMRNSARWKVLISTLEDLNVQFNSKDLDNVVKKSWNYYYKVWDKEWRTPNAREIIDFIWLEMEFEYNPQAVDYLVNFFERSLLYSPPNLLPGAKQALINLSSKYKLAIVSDTGFSPGRIACELMEEVGILQYFSAFSFSDETGVAKPHKLAFEKILDDLDCKPQEALHIGDIERTDIAGALSVGMRAIKFEGDPTTLLAQEKTSETEAEFTAKNWGEIEEYLIKEYNLQM